MRKLNSSDLRDLKLLRHYRIIRKWATRVSDLKESDLELLIYLDAIDGIGREDVYYYDNSKNDNN